MIPEEQGLMANIAIVKILEKENVEFVFGIPGSHILPVYNALADSPIQHISAANESGSAFMAGMYGYLTGKPGVLLLTAGPGATNSIVGIAQAFASSFPIVQITADVPLKSPRESFHGVDTNQFLHRMFKDITKFCIRVEDIREMPRLLTQAFEIATSGRPGPVHLSIPTDLLQERVLEDIFVPKSTYASLIPPSNLFFETVVTQLVTAKRPVIVAGRGVLIENACSELANVCEIIGAPVLNTTYAFGAVSSDNPLSIGTFSEFSGNKSAFELIQNADYLLLIGLRADTLMTQILQKFTPHASHFLAFENDDGYELENTWPGQIERASVKVFLTMLCERLVSHRREANEKVLSEVKQLNQWFKYGLNLELAPYRNTVPMHFGVVMQILASKLCREAIVTSGVGNHHLWARNILPVHDRTSFVAEAAWGTMGGELGAGIAAKIACPDRQVVVVTGDGSLLMVLGEFAMAVQHHANILVVVLNDSHHGIIGEMQRRLFGRSYGELIQSTNFAKCAEAMGGIGIRVEHPSELDVAMDRALVAVQHSPVIFDAVCGANFPWPSWDTFVSVGKSSHREY
jgi:acetolactate synthase I/II/III large subunit